MDHTILKTANFIALLYMCLFPVVIEKASVLIGNKIGAMSMAPMITGTEFMRSHRVQMMLESTNCTRYIFPKFPSSTISSATSVFILSSSPRKAIL